MKKMIFMIASILSVGAMASASPRQVPAEQMDNYKKFLTDAVYSLYRGSPDCGGSAYQAGVDVLDEASTILVDDSGTEPSIVVTKGGTSAYDGAEMSVMKITTSPDQKNIMSYTVQHYTYQLSNEGTLVDINPTMQWVPRSSVTCIH